MSQASRYRELSPEQLDFALRERQQDLFKLRCQSTTERLDAPSQMRRIRRDIARIHTIRRERELSQGVEARS